jgi:murein DD-endopeptidase MepM/ murein hydrolase activator NlpD
MKILKVYLFIFLILPLSGYAKVSVKKLKDQLSKRSNEVFTLGAKIRSLDKTLGSKNDDYLSNMNRVQKLEAVVTELKQKLEVNAGQIAKEYKNTKKLWEYYLINQQDKESEDYIYRRKLLLDVMAKQAKNLKQAQAQSKELLVTLESYDQQLGDYRNNSDTLYELISKLENDKKDLSKKYLNQLDAKNELEEELELAVAKRRAYNKKKKTTSKSNVEAIPVKLMLPLRNYLSYKGSSKGMTFKYKKVAPVHATERGKIVYSGELSSYGKVIMIDHGHDIRSVILGDLNIKATKGSVVKKGDILGYVNSDAGITKTLYYEVRKKNIAQNTVQLLKKIKTI